VEPGETDVEAVIREVAEETALRVEVGSLCGVVTRPAPRGEFEIYDYECAVLAGTARAGDDAAAVRWVTGAQFDDLDEDGRLVSRLAETLRGWGVAPTR
jgi:ADP-ribose pyrophosphatase YjhB (NUDIX family)